MRFSGIQNIVTICSALALLPSSFVWAQQLPPQLEARMKAQQEQQAAQEAQESQQPAGQATATPSAPAPASPSAGQPVAAEVINTPRGGEPAGSYKVDVPSILFTYWEYTAIMDAKLDAGKSGVRRDVTEEEIKRSLDGSVASQASIPKPPPEARYITLNGITFVSRNDWTVWLNGQRIRPDALPKEIIDLKVYRHHIDVKWMDDYTMQVYPIRLRANQRFHLDTRMFLPG